MTCSDSALQPRPQNTPAAEQGARQRSSGCGAAGASGMVRKGPGLVLGKPVVVVGGNDSWEEALFWTEPCQKTGCSDWLFQ